MTETISKNAKGQCEKFLQLRQLLWCVKKQALLVKFVFCEHVSAALLLAWTPKKYNWLQKQLPCFHTNNHCVEIQGLGDGGWGGGLNCLILYEKSSVIKLNC